MARESLADDELLAGARCTYCGVLAECRDHFVPTAYSSSRTPSKKLYKRAELVPSCNECNALASSRVFLSVDAKREFIHGALSQRYKKILNFPEWSDEDVAELSPKLQKLVLLKARAKHVMQNRLNWPDVNYDEFKDAREIWALLASLLRET